LLDVNEIPVYLIVNGYIITNVYFRPLCWHAVAHCCHHLFIFLFGGNLEEHSFDDQQCS